MDIYIVKHSKHSKTQKHSNPVVSTSERPASQDVNGLVFTERALDAPGHCQTRPLCGKSAS